MKNILIVLTLSASLIAGEMPNAPSAERKPKLFSRENVIAFTLNTADPRFAEMRAAYGERILAFSNTDPTTEVLARDIFRSVREKLAAQAGDPTYPIAATVRLERVRVTETATSWAEYWE